MRKLRTLIALVTVAALLLSFGGFASAQYTDVPAGAPYAKQVELLTKLNVVTGFPDNTFRPDELLTREQFAAFVVRALGRDRLAKAFADNATTFKDDAKISSWARGYVVLAASMKIINGFPDGTFRPQEELTYAQTLTMLVRALGFDSYAKTLGGWPAGYLLAAENLGLTKGLEEFVADLPIDRADMAVATFNAVVASYEPVRDPQGNIVDVKAVAKGEASLLRKTFGYNEAQYNEATGQTPQSVTGTFKRYLSASNRIELADGSTHSLADTVTVTINGYRFKVDDDPATQQNEAQAFAVADLKDGDSVGLTVDRATGKVTAIAATRNTYAVIPVVGATVDTGETAYGYITVKGFKKNNEYRATQEDNTWTAVDFRIRVTADTTVELDGQKVSLKDLGDALKAFASANGDKPALATVRVAGNWNTGAVQNNVDTLHKAATYVSVITKNVVKGDVRFLGTDSGGNFVVLRVGNEDKKIYYNLFNANDANWSGTVTLLTDASGVARIFIGSTAAQTAKEQVFWAHALSVTRTSDNKLVSVNAHTAKMTEPVTATYEGVQSSGAYTTPVDPNHVKANGVVAIRLTATGRVRMIFGATDNNWTNVNAADQQPNDADDPTSELFAATGLQANASLLSGSVYMVTADVNGAQAGDETVFIDASTVIILKKVGGSYVHSTLTVADLVANGKAKIAEVYATKQKNGTNYFAQIIVTNETQ